MILSQIHLFALLSYLAICLYVLFQNPGDRLNRSCALFIACLAVWSIEKVALSTPGISLEMAWLWSSTFTVGWIGLAPALLWFVQVLTGRSQRPRDRWFLRLAVAAGAILLVAQFHRLIVSDFVRMPYGWAHRWSDSPWAWMFITFYSSVMIAGLVMLLAYIRQPSGAPLKRQARLFFIYTNIGLGLASLTDTVAPLLEWETIPPVGNVVCLVWAAGLSYSIVKHRFLVISPAAAAENIITAMSDLLILTDLKGRIVRVNRAVEECLECGRQLLEGRPIAEILNIGDPVNITAGPVWCQDRIENRRLELKTKSGRSVPVILSSSPIVDGDQPAGKVILIKDISRLQSAEEALQVSEARFRELVETINEVVFSLDAQGKLTYVSPAFESMTGHFPQAVLGRPIADFIHADDKNRLREQLADLFAGHVHISRYRLLRKTGDFCWVQASGKPVVVGDRITGANGIFTDITAQINAQEEKKALVVRLARAEKMEAIGTLAGAVAHDLNNVLSGIVSYPELMLLDLPEDSPLRKKVRIIQTSGEKAAAIVQDLLTLARRGVLTYEPVDINQIVNEYLISPEHLKLRSLYPRIRVKVDLAHNLESIMGSPVHLAKTLMNLMNNAFEAIPAEGGLITLKTENNVLEYHPSLDDGERAEIRSYVALKIKDTGSGIASEDRERIFEPFFTRKVMGRSGTGLGMAVVWGTVQDHNGRIELESRPGQGTEFALYFPAVPGKQFTAKDELEPEACLGSGESILLVDDVADQRRIASDILERLGYKVAAVGSGEGAIEFLKERQVDLVILDMLMEPGMDGLETFRRISEIRSGQKVILASGYSECERIQTALDSGVLACLKKPYLVKEISATVRAALSAPVDR
ncbi:MAG: PAS domain S-box protein [Desulfobacteraceae bacterium]|nr:MAG: PAS domain S-box protein [Desulfobacteraceae bacterium]